MICQLIIKSIPHSNEKQAKEQLLMLTKQTAESKGITERIKAEVKSCCCGK